MTVLCGGTLRPGEIEAGSSQEFSITVQSKNESILSDEFEYDVRVGTEIVGSFTHGTLEPGDEKQTTETFTVRKDDPGDYLVRVIGPAGTDDRGNCGELTVVEPEGGGGGETGLASNITILCGGTARPQTTTAGQSTEVRATVNTRNTSEFTIVGTFRTWIPATGDTVTQFQRTLDPGEEQGGRVSGVVEFSNPGDYTVETIVEDARTPVFAPSRKTRSMYRNRGKG